MRRTYWLILMALIIGGSSLAFLSQYLEDEDPKAEIVALEQVAEPLVKKAKVTLPDVTFDHARKLSNGNFEIRGKTKTGKIREVEMTPSGDVIEIE